MGGTIQGSDASQLVLLLRPPGISRFWWAFKSWSSRIT